MRIAQDKQSAVLGQHSDRVFAPRSGRGEDLVAVCRIPNYPATRLAQLSHAGTCNNETHADEEAR